MTKDEKKQHSLTVRLSPIMKKKLALVSAMQGRSRLEILSDAVEKYLETCPELKTLGNLDF